ncbi:unnamed protein product [Vitrella brassicaformis CCMP3155]|uniref:Cupin type-1 domain-containing protein n=1 Tax=Vitrella brassicaformis (strain CCMP3155) TaxID=1169540 RepID=A0A0G4EDV6_VITBC|nr:unnamed protein product [Vitrella brassicaformis CCMP3155]|mmetsp:Transcript_37217/g.93459  ORF Transcript_37217/g.93459 Transcript_37217/m.93459 type:complete len:264 (-) Transcript_37217:346-1137(-)|eukprot:CEL93728.1 unnamed protein product [Vitrella brassicaformis CCMP3155]
MGGESAVQPPPQQQQEQHFENKMASDTGLPPSGVDAITEDGLPPFVEVYDEPRHTTCVKNDYCIAMKVRFPCGDTTWYHRHKEDTVFVFMGNMEIHNCMCLKSEFNDSFKLGEVRYAALKDRPYVHKATALKSDTPNKGMFAIDAEHTGSPPTVSSSPLADASHSLVLDQEKVRAYRLMLPAACTVRFSYPFYGLWVVVRGGKATITEEIAEGTVGRGQTKEEPPRGESHVYQLGDLWWGCPASITYVNEGTEEMEIVICEWK